MRRLPRKASYPPHLMQLNQRSTERPKADHLRSANGHWTDMHDCAKEGLGFRLTTTKNVTVSDNGRIVPVQATVANKEFTRALVFNPLSATFSGIAAILGSFMYAIDTSLCLSIVSRQSVLSCDRCLTIVSARILRWRLRRHSLGSPFLSTSQSLCERNPKWMILRRRLSNMSVCV